MNSQVPSLVAYGPIELTIVMPCLNEVRTLQGCIEEAMKAMEAAGIRGEVVIADNGSTDGSQSLALSLGARVVAVRQRGYGSALRGGIIASRGEYVVMGDCDGSYWYARNWWMTGYPLYPKGSPDMSQRILYEDLSKTTLWGNGDPSVPDLLIDAVWEMAGPLHLIALWALPAMVIVTIVSFITTIDRDNWKQSQTWLDGEAFLRCVLIAGIAGCGCIWIITPMLVEDQPGTLNHLRWGYGPVRYGATFLSTAVIGLSAMIGMVTHNLSRRISFVIIWLFGGSIVLQVVLLATRTVRFDLVTASLLGATLGLTVLMLRRLTKQSRIFKLLLIPGGVLSICIAIHFLSVRWHEGFANHFDRYDDTDAYSAMKDETHRIVVLSNRAYPFFGSRRQNVILQPMLFYGVDAVAETCETLGADMVVTRVDNHKILARYRPGWNELSEDPRFDPIESASKRLKLFHYEATTPP